MKQKDKKGGFLGMLFVTLAPILLGILIPGKAVI